MSGITTKLNSNVDKVIKELDRADQKKRAKAAVYATRELRSAAPMVTGDLRGSIKTKNWRRSTGVGFTRPKGSHAPLVEYGHDIFQNGAKVGRTKANPFFKEKWNAMVPELIKIMSEAVT